MGSQRHGIPTADRPLLRYPQRTVTTLRRLLVLLALLLAGLPSVARAAELTLYVFDVGQGDAMLIVSPVGKTVLVDAGPPDAADKLARRLKELVHGPIDLMLMTHPHADHIGGLVQVIQALPVDRIITNGELYTTRTFEDFVDAIAAA